MYAVLCTLCKVSLSRSPSCALKRKETLLKNGRLKSWGRKARKGKLPIKPDSLICRGRVIFRCDFLRLLTVTNSIPYPDLFSLSLNPWSCVKKNISKYQVAKLKHWSFFLDTQSACTQAAFRETAKEVVERKSRGIEWSHPI